MILVTGFGPFGRVIDNPSARAALEVHGRRVAGETVIGRVLPVSYARASAEVSEVVAASGPVRLVVGLGVATNRGDVEVERTGRRTCDPARPDVDGVGVDDLGGPELVPATIDVEALARALKARISDDAGGYVCNAWLFRVAQALPDVPVGFVHIPAAGIATDRLLAGLRALL